MKNYRIPSLLCDFYKVSHAAQYPQGTEYVYSTLTPRNTKYFLGGRIRHPRIVSFGFQSFVKNYLIDFFNEHFFARNENEVVAEYEDLLRVALGAAPDSSHIRALHRIGYLPLEIRAVPEGKTVAVSVPVLTIVNTKPEFFWLTNYFETLLSCQTWQPMTSASIALAMYQLANEYADKTCDDVGHIPFQAHDFSMRGMSSLETAELSGMGHLLYFTGTDNIPAMMAAKHFYGKDLPQDYLFGASIPATEHSVMSAHTKGDAEKIADEYETYRYLLQDVYPNGFVSIVSDTYDFWHNVTEVFPRLKDIIMQRDGRFVVRPDSGDPVEILCGIQIDAAYSDEAQFHKDTFVPDWDNEEYDFLGNGEVVLIGNRYAKVFLYADDEIPAGQDHPYRLEYFEPTAQEKGLIQCLWDTFGGVVNSKGYKVLDSHIGAIYGDSITYQRMMEIFERLERKSFASSNVVFGIGSYTYQYVTRDVLGFAVKCTAVTIDGDEHIVFKAPKTDSKKKSQRGRVKVVNNGDSYVDNLYSDSDYSDDVMQTIFKDGKLLVEDNFQTLRERAVEDIQEH